jgi:polar amino acid transport system permease protein
VPSSDGPPPTPDAPEAPLDLTARRALPGMRGFNEHPLASSLVASLVVLAVGIWVVWFAPGSAVFREAYFNGSIFHASLFGDPSRGVVSVVHAFVLNIKMFSIAEVLVLVLAIPVALIRNSASPVLLPIRFLTTAYVDIVRGVPMILLIYMVAFGFPALGLPYVSTKSVMTYGIFVLVFAYTAFVSEVYRIGLLSVPGGQVLASRSLGLSRFQTWRHVVFPQALRISTPGLLNDFVSLQKDTALVGTVGLIEALQAAKINQGVYFNDTPFTVSAVMFMVVCVPLCIITDRLIRSDRVKRLAGVSL